MYFNGDVELFAEHDLFYVGQLEFDIFDLRFFGVVYLFGFRHYFDSLFHGQFIFWWTYRETEK